MGEINKTLDVCDMDLLVLSVSHFDGYGLNYSGKLQTRVVYDYEIEYYRQSDGGIVIDGKMVNFSKGDINFRKPGQIVAGVMPYSCINLCFDVLGDKEKTRNYKYFGTPEQAQARYENSILEKIPNKIEAAYCKGIEVIMRRIYQNYTLSSIGTESVKAEQLEVRSDLYQLIAELYKASNANNNKYIAYNRIIKKSLEFIKQNYKHEITIEQVAKYAGVSTNYFQATFKKSMGITPNNYITKLRLEQAEQLLIMTALNIGDVGFECGFLDNVYFSYVFKKHYKLTPNEFRKLYQG